MALGFVPSAIFVLFFNFLTNLQYYNPRLLLVCKGFQLSLCNMTKYTCRKTKLVHCLQQNLL